MKVYAILGDGYREGQLRFLEHNQGYWSEHLNMVKEEFNDMVEGIKQDYEGEDLEYHLGLVKIVKLTVKEIENA